MRSARMRLLSILGLGLALLFMGACGCIPTPVEVPPAHVGKISDGSGLSKRIYTPGKTNLNNMCIACPKMVLVEASDWPATEAMDVYMPKDSLVLHVEVRGTFAINTDQADQVFSRVPPASIAQLRAQLGDDIDEDRVSLIPMETVYETYAQQVIREVVRSFVVDYTIIDVNTRRAELGAALASRINALLENSPITAIQFGFADIQPPDIIVQANAKAKERQIQIEQAKADKEVQLTQAEAKLAVARKEQEIDLVHAETQVLVQKALDKSLSPAFIMQRYLAFLMEAAKNENTVFLPYESLQGSNDGISFRIFNDELLRTMNAATHEGTPSGGQ